MKSVWIIVDDDGKLYGVFDTRDKVDWAHDHMPMVLHEETHVEHWVLNEVYS